jgi:hypothetical protein
LSRATPVRRVNWHQATAEVALILIGVLAALAVDNWWVAQQENKEARTYLEALLADFQENRQSLQEAVEVQKNIIGFGDEILRLLSEGLGDENADVFFERFRDFYYFKRWAPITGTYDDLVGSGKLLLISNLSLRNELSAFQRILASIREFEGLQSETYYEIQAPFANKHFDGTENFYLAHSTWLDNDQPPQFPYEFDLAPYNSTEYWNLVVAWMWVHADVVTYYRNGISACDQIIELIEAELAANGG